MHCKSRSIFFIYTDIALYTCTIHVYMIPTINAASPSRNPSYPPAAYTTGPSPHKWRPPPPRLPPRHPPRPAPPCCTAAPRTQTGRGPPLTAAPCGAVAVAALAAAGAPALLVVLAVAAGRRAAVRAAGAAPWSPPRASGGGPRRTAPVVVGGGWWIKERKGERWSHGSRCRRHMKTEKTGSSYPPGPRGSSARCGRGRRRAGRPAGGTPLGAPAV